MKTYLFIGLVLFLIIIGCATKRAEPLRIKRDLIGQTMGGKEKSWKFQSVDQIKDFVIKDKINRGDEEIYVVCMVLHDDRVKDVYQSDARIIYKLEDGQWKIKSVGLLDIKKIN